MDFVQAENKHRLVANSGFHSVCVVLTENLDTRQMVHGAPVPRALARLSSPVHGIY